MGMTTRWMLAGGCALALAACSSSVVRTPSDRASGPATVSTPRPGATTAQLEHALRDTVERLVQDGVSEPKTRRAIRQITAGNLLALDGLGAAPRMIGGSLAIGLPLADVEFWAEKLERVTAARATAAARAVLTGNPVATAGWLLPAGA